jgi:uncharacterized OsmC-like protein
MREQKKIKEALGRTVKALTLKPSLGIDTGTSVTRVTNGLTCEVTEKTFKLTADMPESVGGNGAGPTPGVYGRAALGSCLAIGYMMRASQQNIPVESLQVEVQADFDDGVLFGTAKGRAGYSEIRYTITIESDADEQDILQVIEEADNRSPYLDVFSSGSKCIRKVNIVSTKQS